jgi:hypothetical protein
VTPACAHGYIWRWEWGCGILWRVLGCWPCSVEVLKLGAETHATKGAWEWQAPGQPYPEELAALPPMQRTLFGPDEPTARPRRIA